jgi:hypothetical protein
MPISMATTIRGSRIENKISLSISPRAKGDITLGPRNREQAKTKTAIRMMSTILI